MVAAGVLELADETGDKWKDLAALRPTEAPPVVEHTVVTADVTEPLTEAEFVESLRKSLMDAARNGKRPNWKTIARRWRRTGLPFPLETRVCLLVTIDAPRAQGKPVLASMVKNKSDGPCHHFGEVLAGLGWSRGMSPTMVEPLRKREPARAYDAYRQT
ncbi:hypothetical protein OG762_12580 [Streptomyces sp. NBC_01136]|uniref:hypothetical protein n=1 Tax=unclassified Streptomyces TaxID=2593676 RepID=UPI003246487A|nr:hypothetical protein OG762_12580 [Streptomyces sp. NBC_01136]